MNDKKNIDRLFQERFKDFEEIPPPQAWENIQHALKKKEKNRKVIPFWLKRSGLAAAFLLGLVLLQTVSNDNNDFQNDFTTTPKTVKNSADKKDSTLSTNPKVNNPAVVKKNLPVVVNIIKTAKKDEKNTIHHHRFKSNTHQEKNQNAAFVYFKKNNPSVKKSIKNNQNQIDHQLVDNNSLENEPKPMHNLLYEPFGESDAANQPNTTIAIAEVQNTADKPNELEKILQEQKNPTPETLLAKPKNKWQIMPKVAAMYMPVNSSGSAIDPQFSENQKTPQNSLSYGLGVHYAFSKRLALRGGINRFLVGYNTNNVVYSTGLVNNNLTNIRYSSKAFIEIKNNASLNALSPSEKALQKSSTGAINQKMGYYEIPMEISYVVLDKKISIDVIGGFSTLFLNQNKISLISTETNINLGEAKNLSPIHFSTNVGLGFRYKMAKAFQINIEPMLKYQINTFSSNSGAFKPMFIGLYSGVSYNF